MTAGKNVGERIANIRQLKNITREELADRCQFSAEMLARLEESEAIPSLGHLVKIARALGERLGTFLDDMDESGPVICRQGLARPGASFSNKKSNARVNLDFAALASDKSGRHMEPFIIDIDSTERTDYIMSSHEGEEFVYVLSGSIEIIYGKETHILEPGDSIYYDSVVEHHIHSANGQTGKILAVVYAPF